MRSDTERWKRKEETEKRAERREKRNVKIKGSAGATRPVLLCANGLSELVPLRCVLCPEAIPPSACRVRLSMRRGEGRGKRRAGRAGREEKRREERGTWDGRMKEWGEQVSEKQELEQTIQSPERAEEATSSCHITQANTG